ncbi:hypothetical protein GWK47_010896 [Chionoecetes opilio]|uniref:Uncharacterized protein n=1 Tax=Chionoecetes opilio TaxID=41210 RepID=A0A8J4XWU3_CHIOP|nr:hypothetical protein GWK47_010896 [Chionoecetes opilio]
MTTRKQTEVWLLGHSVPTITGAKLPSRGDVLRRFFYAHKEEKKTVQQSAAEAAKEVLDFWTRARILTIAETSVRRKITGLFDEWKILSKSKNNSGVTPGEKQKTFQESLPDLLDIAHSDALTLMTIPEDKEFLLAQREKGRRGSMAGLDKKLKESVCRRESSLSRSRQQTPKGEEMVELESSSSESSSPANATNTSTSSSDAGVASPPKRLRTRGTKSFLSPDLVGALDRTGVSSRQALRIVAATASSLGPRSTRACAESRVHSPRQERSTGPLWRRTSKRLSVLLNPSYRSLGRGRSFLRTMALAPKDSPSSSQEKEWRSS